MNRISSKRTCLLFSIILIGIPSLSLYAQEVNKAPEVQKFSIGIKLGPSVTFASYPDRDQRDQFKTQPKFGMGGQVFVNFPLSRTGYTFLSEAGYAIRGRKFKIKSDGGEFVNNATYQFVELSMGLRKSFNLKLVENIPSKWFINIGPNIQYWVNGKGKLQNTEYKVVFNQPPDGDLYTNYINDPNRWFFGIDVGIGADAPINSKQKVRVELRTTFGQTYLGKKTATSNLSTIVWQDDLRSNLKTISLTGAYTLDFDMRNMKMGKSNTTKSVKGNVGKYRAPKKKKRR